MGEDGVYNMAVQWAAYLCSWLVYLTLIPLPIGLIGAWRWGVWAYGVALALFIVPCLPLPTTTYDEPVIPVYKPGAGCLSRRLALMGGQPTEIIAVIDHSDQQCMQIFREFEQACTGSRSELKMIVTKVGKRPALVDGMMRSSGEDYLLVDSDTVWAPDVLVNAIAPFVDPTVGGVTTRQ